MQWFGTLCGGTYIKLGGLDGVRYSNSHVFNKALGWKDVLIELREDNFKQLVVNCPDKIAAINAGVCSQTKTLHEVTTGVETPMGGYGSLLCLHFMSSGGEVLPWIAPE
jgi:hypothetical protein